MPLPDRATIANMCPEYRATMAFFPVDDVTPEYLRLTGRTVLCAIVLSIYALCLTEFCSIVHIIKFLAGIWDIKGRKG